MVYFKQLIGKFRKYREETSSSEVEESMMYDYLVKMQELKSSGTSTHFTGETTTST
jgi:cytochrome P450 family 2 subfamily J